MTIDEAREHIRDIICENKSIAPSMTVFELEKEALYIAIDSLELISNLTDRPCLVCKFNIKNGLCNSCSEWECPFDEVLNKRGKSETYKEVVSIIQEQLDKSIDLKECITLRWVLDKIAEVETNENS